MTGADSKLVGVSMTVIEKDSEDYLEYQVELKQYITDKSKYRESVHKCFNIIIGQCSRSMEQNLEADDIFKGLKTQ